MSNRGHWRSRIEILIQTVAVSCALALVVSGCAEARSVAVVTWVDAEPVIQPQPTLPNTDGWLEVETEADMMPRTDETDPDHDPFWLYSESGAFLRKESNEDVLPISLSPGRYIVVAWASGKLRKVQVVIAANATTHVTEKRLDQAPRAAEAPPQTP